MSAPKYPGDETPALDSEVAFAGYDPYIVALTGGSLADPGNPKSSVPDPATESRKVKLMTWLRERRA